MRRITVFKRKCRGFEDHMAAYYDFEIVKSRNPGAGSPGPGKSLGDLGAKYSIRHVDPEFLA